MSDDPAIDERTADATWTSEQPDRLDQYAAPIVRA
jgi:hypothetical protein